MPKRNNFIEGLRRKQQRAAEAERAAPPGKKDPSEMTDEELDRELARGRAVSARVPGGPQGARGGRLIRRPDRNNNPEPPGDGILVVYDLRDAAQWTAAGEARRAWGRDLAVIHDLDQDHVLIEFRAGGLLVEADLMRMAARHGGEGGR